MQSNQILSLTTTGSGLIGGVSRAISEKRIRKSSKYADKILSIQKQLVDGYNSMGNQAQYNIAPKTIESYQKIVDSQKRSVLK